MMHCRKRCPCSRKKERLRLDEIKEEGDAFHHHQYMCLLTHLPLHVKLWVTVSYSRQPERDIYLMLNATLNQSPTGEIDNI